MENPSLRQRFLEALISALQSHGWNVELNAQLPGSNYVADAVIQHKMVNRGQSFYLELADYEFPETGKKTTEEDREEFWSEAVTATKQSILIAYPHQNTNPDIDTMSINWSLLGIGGSNYFTVPVFELASRLGELDEGEIFEPAEANDSLTKTWICQYRPGNFVSNWTRDSEPGSVINWKTEQKSLPGEMSPGDAVIYWRSIDPDDKTNRGGLVGTGKILSTELAPDSAGINRFPTEVIEFFENRLIPRDEVVSYAGIDRQVWRGAVLDIPPEQAAKVNELLQKKGFLPLNHQPLPGKDSIDERNAEVNVRRDDAEQDHDSLGRSTLAVTFAWRLHETWCTTQGLNPFPGQAPPRDTPGFLAHIDAPWGGGKTSFANLIARTLNPDLDSKAPEFLRKLYPERQDMSGLFIKAAHEEGALMDSRGVNKWSDEARQPWIIVPFNAWLNQHVDPPWWSFYQTIRKQCFSAIWREGTPTVKQKSTGEYYTEKSPLLSRIWRYGRLWSREIWWRFWTPRVRNAVLTFALVVTISLILKYFGQFDLKGLINSANSGNSSSLSSVIATTLMVILGGASALWSVFATFTQTLLSGTPESARNYSLGSADPLTRFRQHFAQTIKVVERPVLVIIDDIDRCEPKFIVEMTRGLQTILKSPRIIYLLLGDRKWIEQAFEIHHQDMKDIDVGPQHTFGGRFIEKAIQLSFVLPDIGDRKENYVHEVLSGRSSIDSENRLELRNRIAKATTVEQIDVTAAEARDDITSPSAVEKSAEQRLIREEVVLARAAQNTEVDDAIRHRLQPLAQFLPGNPRHIKRIINAISMYQNSIVLTEVSSNDARFGGLTWRRLVIGVVLMIGHPKSWSQLVEHPEWADELIENGNAAINLSADEALNPDYAELVENTDFVNLLSQTELYDDETGAPTKTKITGSVVQWLNRIIPIAAG